MRTLSTICLVLIMLSVPACSKKNGSNKGEEQTAFKLAGSRPNIILIMAYDLGKDIAEENDISKENSAIVIAIEKYLGNARVDSEHWIAE